LNGKTVAEQIGRADIIDDGRWSVPAIPNSAYLADRRAGSHDGDPFTLRNCSRPWKRRRFVEPNVHTLLDVGLNSCQGCVIRRVVEDVAQWHAGDNRHDWERTAPLIAERYGYDKFPGNCHVVPNHALIILATAYGENSFQDAMRSPTPRDGIRLQRRQCGLPVRHQERPRGDRRGTRFPHPVADRMYISTAEAEMITDAVIEAQSLMARHALAGASPLPLQRTVRASISFSRQPAGLCFEDRIARAPASGRVGMRPATAGRVNVRSDQL